MTTTSFSRRSLLAATSALLVAGLPAGMAFAHADFKSSSPAPNSTVTAPASLSIIFGEDISLKFSGVTISGPDKAPVKTGEASLDAKNPAKLTVPVAETLAAGKYTVEWHNLSTDGHKSKGSFTFTVK